MNFAFEGRLVPRVDGVGGMSAEMTVVLDPALRGLHGPQPLAITVG